MARRTKKRVTKRQLRRTAKRKVMTGGNPDKEPRVINEIVKSKKKGNNNSKLYETMNKMLGIKPQRPQLPLPTNTKPYVLTSPPTILPETKKSQFNSTNETVYTRKAFNKNSQDYGRGTALYKLVNSMTNKNPTLSSENLIQQISKIAGRSYGNTKTGFKISPFKRNVLNAENTNTIKKALNIIKNPLFSEAEAESPYSTIGNEVVGPISVVAGNETPA